MSKDPHKVFEIYTARDEAAWELMPKGKNAINPAAASDAWTFQKLVVEQLVGITHVRFQDADLSQPDAVKEVQAELVQLADKLAGNSRVLVDFTGVESFGIDGINALIACNKRLRVRGSRMVLCCLDTNVRATFFAAP